MVSVSTTSSRVSTSFIGALRWDRGIGAATARKVMRGRGIRECRSTRGGKPSVTQRSITREEISALNNK